MTFLKWITSAAALGLALLLGSGLLALPAQAGYVVTLQEVGNNVVATGSGSIDLTGLSLLSPSQPADAFMTPRVGVIIVGPEGITSVDDYVGFTGPESFGPGNQTVPFFGVSGGDKVGVISYVDTFVVQAGYVSGDPLFGFSTYNDATFETLGVTPGT